MKNEFSHNIFLDEMLFVKYKIVQVQHPTY